DILSATDSVLKVKIPDLASSGMITLTVLKEVFAGPFFRVKGAIQIDSSFHSLPGVTGGIINRILFIPGGQCLIGGNFIDYGNSGYKNGMRGIARLNKDGSLDRSFEIGEGIEGTVNDMVAQANNKYIIGGNFNNYNDLFKVGYVSNIIRVKSDGSMDTSIINTQTGSQEVISS